MSVRELVRENPWKALIGSISISTLLFTGVGTIFSELRYAKTDEVKELKAEIQKIKEEASKK